MLRTMLMRSFRRLIPSINFISRAYSTKISRNFIAFGGFNSLKLRSFSQLSQLGEQHKNEERRLVVEAKAGSDSGPVIVAPNCTENGNEVGEDSKEKNIKEGDIINLRDLLFTENRDYLIRYIDNKRVKAEHLAGKVVVLYFVPLCIDYDIDWDTVLLMDVYNDLQPDNGFEIVLVPTDDVDANCSENSTLDHFLSKCFHDILLCMPWTGIPLSDITCRKHLQRSFSVNTMISVIDSTGLVLQCDKALSIFETYGAIGYPFSEERIKFLEAEDKAAAKNPSLKTLLASPQRDYLISNTGEKVPINTLEDKVVALFFYEVGRAECVAERLKVAYMELKKMKRNFEVVLVYISRLRSDVISSRQYGFYCVHEESFWEVFKTMPWLALPFKDSNVERLKRIFEFDPHHFYHTEDEEPPNLVIFGPHGDFIEPFGAEIMSRCKIQAYPFTRESVAKLETEKVKNLKLEMLWDPNTVFRGKDGTEVPISQLVGKRVMLYLENSRYDPFSHHDKIKFLKLLKERYLGTKGTDDEFEVIHIFSHNIECSLTEHVGDLPWLVSLTSQLLPTVDFGLFLCHKEVCYSYEYFKDDDIFAATTHCPILAFDRDGRLVRRSNCPTFDNMDFPFYAGSLQDETLSYLIHYFGWEHWRLFPKGGRIYSRLK